MDEYYIKSQPAGSRLDGEICFENETNNIGTHCKPVIIILKPNISVYLTDDKIAELTEGSTVLNTSGSTLVISNNDNNGYPLYWKITSKPDWLYFDVTTGRVDPGKTQEIPIHAYPDILKYKPVGRHIDWFDIEYIVGDTTHKKSFTVEYFVHLNISNKNVDILIPEGGPITFSTSDIYTINSLYGKIEWAYEGILKYVCKKTNIASYILDCKFTSVDDTKRWIDVSIGKGGILDINDYYNFSVSIINTSYLFSLPAGHRETLCVHISSSDDYGFHREGWSDYVDGPCFYLKVFKQFDVIGGDASFTVDSSGNSIPNSYSYTLTAEHLGTTFSVETDVNWLDISQNAGNVSKNNPATVSISPNSNAANLQAGTYTGKIYFKDPHGKIIATKNVTLEVTAPTSNNLCTLPPTPMDDNFGGLLFDFDGTNCSFSTNNGIINFFISPLTTGTFTVVSWTDNGVVTGISPIETIPSEGIDGICLNTDVLVNVNYNNSNYQGIFSFSVNPALLPQGGTTANCPNGLFLDANTILPSNISIELKSWKKIN